VVRHARGEGTGDVAKALTQALEVAEAQGARAVAGRVRAAADRLGCAV